MAKPLQLLQIVREEHTRVLLYILPGGLGPAAHMLAS